MKAVLQKDAIICWWNMPNSLAEGVCYGRRPGLIFTSLNTILHHCRYLIKDFNQQPPQWQELLRPQCYDKAFDSPNGMFSYGLEDIK